ncbi:MAG: selenocysteine-specific translation elongation factor [Streptosporangiaceae bacterium]
MQVIATAGHIDHGKSALVRALTGMEPDRWAEERRRGMTIDLGYAWLALPSGERLAFVDVPGHERFVPNMLAGVGPVPGVLFVVAADEGWMPQSAEHLAVIDALGISRGLLAVTRADLADPGPAMAQAAALIARTSLGAVESFAVSAVTGAGLPQLVAGLDRLAAALPAPDPRSAVRLWVDRAFSITGSGTVVTGTLPAGTVRAGDELLVTPSMQPVRVRGIESLGEPAAQASGVARVALNLRGASLAGAGRGGLRRGMALITGGCWTLTDMADVRLSWPAVTGGAAGTIGANRTGGTVRPPLPRLPREMTLHVGSARTVCRVRSLGDAHARLTLSEPLPLHVGDRVLLRDPGAARADGHPAVVGAIILDVAPPPLTRHGAAAAAAAQLATWPDRPTAAELLRRHGLLRTTALRAMGVDGQPAEAAAGWLADPAHRRDLERRLAGAVAAHAAANPLAPGMPAEAARAAIGVPDRRLVEALVRPPLTLRAGLITVAERGDREPDSGLPAPVAAAVRALRADLSAAPFGAPEAARLRELGLGSRAIAAAQRAGLLLRVSDQIVLGPDAAALAAAVLARLPQPFTAAQARSALGTTRRVAIPLLEYLDRAGATERLADDRRLLRGPSRNAAADVERYRQ